MLSVTGRSEKFYVCLSTDTKPTKVPNGTICYVMDTKKYYMFDAENTQWREM